MLKGACDLKTHKGIITFIQWKKLIGFIQDYDGKIVFFSQFTFCGEEFTDLREGMEVEYMRVDTPKGPKAVGVVVR